MAYNIVIPARLASARLPNKPLVDIAGKPMIQHVYERAVESAAQQVIIATDSAEIASVASTFGAEICMTRSDHHSGTERLAEVALKYGFGSDDIIVNVQGDEPCLPAVLMNQVAADLAAHPKAAITTLFSPIESIEEVFDPNAVKVVIDSHGYALLFSRAPIPWLRDHFGEGKVAATTLPHLRHIGLYAYRAGYLQRYSELTASALEQFESLEQLRALFHGHKIHLTEASVSPGHGVDTEADLAMVRQLLG
jgi:3-deoxy-manno-octulosonate cytidylyltransferase (CMP-KDO synthetase)